MRCLANETRMPRIKHSRFWASVSPQFSHFLFYESTKHLISFLLTDGAVFHFRPFFLPFHPACCEPVSHFQVAAEAASQVCSAVANISHLEVRLCFLYLQISVKKLQSISFLHAKEDSFSIQAHLIHAVKMPQLWILIYHSNAILHLDCVSLLKDIRVAHKQHTHFNNTSWKHSILWGGQKNPRRTQCIARKETCLKAEREVTMLMQHS